MDVVYILGTGSKWEDNELRYSIRSLCRNLHGFRRIILVGEKPEWYNGIHIPMEDSFRCKQENIMRKIYAACEYPDISPEFLFVNDDHYLLREQEVDQIGYYAMGTLQDLFEKVKSPQYAMCIKQTIEAIGNVPNFDVHTPIVYNRRLFRDVMDQMIWGGQNTYVIKSLYCGYYDFPHVEYVDRKVDYPSWQMCERHTQGDTWLSSVDHISSGVKGFLMRKFPDPSPYEK